jgi:S-adenosylmethionine synthetase
VAKNIVANGYANECLVSVAYAIGKSEPLMVQTIDENGKTLRKIVEKNFDLTPNNIKKVLKLDNPIFMQTATYGHFGKKGLPWEEIISC